MGETARIERPLTPLPYGKGAFLPGSPRTETRNPAPIFLPKVTIRHVKSLIPALPLNPFIPMQINRQLSGRKFLLTLYNRNRELASGRPFEFSTNSCPYNGLQILHVE